MESHNVSWTPYNATCYNACEADEYQVSYQLYNVQTCSVTGTKVLVTDWQSGSTALMTNLAEGSFYQVSVDSRNLPADGQDPVPGNSVYVIERKSNIFLSLLSRRHTGNSCLFTHFVVCVCVGVPFCFRFVFVFVLCNLMSGRQSKIPNTNCTYKNKQTKVRKSKNKQNKQKRQKKTQNNNNNNNKQTNKKRNKTTT